MKQLLVFTIVTVVKLLHLLPFMKQCSHAQIFNEYH